MKMRIPMCKNCGDLIYQGSDLRWYHKKNVNTLCQHSKGKAEPGVAYFECEQENLDEPLTTELYQALWKVLLEAYDQASSGKGKERHSSGEPFDQQPICQISRSVGSGFALGQAIKKIIESQRLDVEKGTAELLGAINYLAAAIIVRREGK